MILTWTTSNLPVIWLYQGRRPGSVSPKIGDKAGPLARPYAWKIFRMSRRFRVKTKQFSRQIHRRFATKIHPSSFFFFLWVHQPNSARGGWSNVRTVDRAYTEKQTSLFKDFGDVAQKYSLFLSLFPVPQSLEIYLPFLCKIANKHVPACQLEQGVTLLGSASS